MWERPKIKPKPTPVDKWMEILTWISLALLWGLAILGLFILPEQIPIHFNAAGEVDNYGKKSSILILPIFGSILFYGMLKLNRCPHIFNYPVKITKDNAQKQYAIATRMLRFFNFALVFVFMVLVLEIIFISVYKTSGLGIWFLPFVFGLFLIPMVYFITKSFQAKP